MPGEPTTLRDVAEAVGGAVHGHDGVLLTDVVHDSRAAHPGALFCAIRGFTVDGHAFVDAAVAAGTSALMVEQVSSIDVPQVVVPDTRAALAPAAALVHRHPSRSLSVIGVTGTNGKTTITAMLESIARAAGWSVGRIGTLGASINGTPVPVAHTTPEASDLQRMLARMRDEDVRLVAMEVSSHALELHRADAVHYDVAAFTNLSQDHLDFHPDMEAYFDAKRRLFDGRAVRHVVAVEDEAGRRLASELDEVVTVGFEPGCDVTAEALVEGLEQSNARLVMAGTSAPITVRPGGRFNVVNAMVAAACAHEVGLSLDSIAEGLGRLERVPGRLDPVDAGQPFTVVVDYAHSPGGVETVVKTALGATEGRVIAVVGSAGDRDAAKRPLMGAAAALADVAVITSDNPRTEDPQTLVDAVMAGTVGSAGEVVAEVDRTKAIHLALDRAEPGDAVLILGKGHEQGQDFGDMVIPYDDREVALRHLEQQGWRS